jgi:hypothetical protein
VHVNRLENRIGPCVSFYIDKQLGFLMKEKTSAYVHMFQCRYVPKRVSCFFPITYIPGFVTGRPDGAKIRPFRNCLDLGSFEGNFIPQ